MGQTAVDLVIVGAGAAGLAAAQAAIDNHLSFVVFEAMDRIGGRAYTDTTAFGAPWDRGCHWLHSASINPMRELADRYGFAYRQSPPPHTVWLDGRWLSDTEIKTLDCQEEALYESVHTVGLHEGRDVSMASVTDPSDPAYAAFVRTIHAEWGHDLDHVSTLDAVRYRDTGENWPLKNGYGALVAHHHRDIPVERSTPVTQIDWSGPGVRVTTNRGTVEARAVIVSVSTNVLAANVIEFVPVLPSWKIEAALAVPLGTANKVAFKIDGRELGVDGHTNVTVPIGNQTMTFQFRPFDYDLINGYLAGPQAREFELAGKQATISAVLDALKSVFGNDIATKITAKDCTNWGREPSILGAYAAARPGQADRRHDLDIPIADRLFFAGEATSPEFFSTCHGAHLSGIAAAYAVAHQLGPR